jgi:hypothetical protein
MRIMRLDTIVLVERMDGAQVANVNGDIGTARTAI